MKWLYSESPQAKIEEHLFLFVCVCMCVAGKRVWDRDERLLCTCMQAENQLAALERDMKEKMESAEKEVSAVQ